MEGYATIGAIYSFRPQHSDKNLMWAVIENNSNDNTSTLLVVEKCPENGRKVKVDAKWLYDQEPIGPILPPAGEIIIEDGKEFVRPVEEKTQSKVLLSKKVKKYR